MSIKSKSFDLMTNETARKLALLTLKCLNNNDDDDDDEKEENISSEVFTSVMSINYLFIYLYYPRFEQPGRDFFHSCNSVTRKKYRSNQMKAN